MLEKIKSNQYKLVLILSIVAGALLVPAVFELLNDLIREYEIIRLICLGFSIAANGILIAYSLTKKKFNFNLLIAPVLVYFLADILDNLYAIMISESFSAIAYMGLDIAIIIVYFIAMKNKKMQNVLYILWLISFAFSLTGILSSHNNLSYMITNLTLGSIIYLNREETE